jgi:hypothetical protein
VRAAALLLPLLLLFGCVSAPAERGSVLIFSHTTGYRHDAIAVAVPAMARIVEAEGLEARASEDPAVFSEEGLKGVRAIVLLSATTDPKDPASEWLQGPRRAALQAFVRRGGGIVAVHAAADSHYHWPWYGTLIGGRFRSHPQGAPRGMLSVVDRGHPATEALPETIVHTDEWYSFKEYDAASRLLMTLDPVSIGASGAAQPIAWGREVEGGRVFYTALGHTAEAWGEPFFTAHLRGGLRWVLGTRR